MSDATATTTETATETPKTPAERLREKLTTLRGNRVGAVARTQKKAAGAAATTVERLLTPEERRKMKKKTRKTQKNNIERLLKQSGITDIPTRNKVFAGIQNGTIGSEAELKRFLAQEEEKRKIVVSSDLVQLAALRRKNGEEEEVPNSSG